MSAAAEDLARLLDHSVLKPEATRANVLSGAALVARLGIGFYCVQPMWVRAAAEALAGSDARVVSVIGFPHGCERSASKAEQARAAIGDGANELDMVLAIGAFLGGDVALAAADVEAVVRAAGDCPVKVILETAALPDDARKRLACRLARDAGAAFVKTSTGFHPAGGATAADVRLMRDEVGTALGVKASGGIRTLADVEAMLAAGASRIGTSASEAILAACAASRA